MHRDNATRGRTREQCALLALVAALAAWLVAGHLRRRRVV